MPEMRLRQVKASMQRLRHMSNFTFSETQRKHATDRNSTTQPAAIDPTSGESHFRLLCVKHPIRLLPLVLFDSFAAVVQYNDEQASEVPLQLSEVMAAAPCSAAVDTGCCTVLCR